MVVILIKKPILEIILIYTSPYIFSIKALEKALLVSILLLNIFKAKAISNTPVRERRDFKVDLKK